MNVEPDHGKDRAGDVSGDPDMSTLPAGESTPDLRARVEELRREVCSRLQHDGHGRWPSAAKARDELAALARRRGMTGDEKLLWVYEELDRLFPTLPPPEPPPEPPQQADGPGQVRGLDRIPPAWGTLPANASLQSEIGWVQANRLLVVEDSLAGGTIVRLKRALSPAPSHAALGWLETSIRSYAKYIDVVARAMSSTITEHEQVQREKHSIEEIHEVLRQMLDE